MKEAAFVPTFTTERLILRPNKLGDVPSYAQNFVDYEVIRHLSAKVPWPYPANGVEEFMTKFILPQQGRDRWYWAVTLKENPDECIGGVELWREGTPEHRGFWLGRKYWGQGLMTEAVAPVQTFAFDKLGFEKLILSNAEGNLKSRRIKEKAGAKLIGLRDAAFVDPRYTKAETWELTREAWACANL